jgi:hypothetical protein
MNTQIHDFLEMISNEVIRYVPEFNKSIFLARIDDEGRILMQTSPTSNEFQWAGLSDTESDYFYIRHRDGGEIFFEEAANGKTYTCGHKRMLTRYELRLVACGKGLDPYNLEEKIRLGLMSCRIPDQPDIKGIQMIPRRSQIDSIQVMKDEVPKPKQFDKNLIFVAVDFDLMFEKSYF